MTQRTVRTFSIDNINDFKQYLFAWSQQFETIVWLDSNNYKQTYSTFDCALAVEEFTAIKTDYQHAFEKLREYQTNTKDYIFGYISYDVKNDVEQMTSNNLDPLNFADLYFFQPQKLIFVKGTQVEFHYLKMIADEIEGDFKEIKLGVQASTEPPKTALEIKRRIPKAQYLQKVTKVIEHIKRGDIYEANFCQEFYAHADIHSLETYFNLNNIAQAPFATFLKNGDKFLLSSSPERYLKKVGLEITSQPIKGTTKRSQHSEEDEDLKTTLERDPKERSENIMIVDLVRNDLSKIAQKGTVNVTELCQIHSFKQVHHMISTVQAKALSTISPVDIIAATFPMGSMTGAPKISAMKLIEKFEITKRGLYSGSIGYITPTGDFDFNVVIRSIQYNAINEYLSFMVGGAITIGSDAEMEYQECLLKAKALFEVLQGNYAKTVS